MEVHDNHHHSTLRLLMGLIAFIVLGAVLYLVIAHTSVQSTQQSVGAATSTSTQTATSSPVQSSQPVATSTQTSNPQQRGSTGASTITITNADMNQTVQLRTGEEFAVQLGSGLHWTLAFDPADAVSQLEGSSTDGIQGVYKAIKPGTINLRATGAPVCKLDVACPMFLAEFNVILSVN